ncbi:hypothetical protein HT031_006065 [Scenedesmus sp. PABB004]|nr:hypothetical protein HT031_006065 [Scenedesmus sp. PABB004]
MRRCARAAAALARRDCSSSGAAAPPGPAAARALGSPAASAAAAAAAAAAGAVKGSASRAAAPSRPLHASSAAWSASAAASGDVAAASAAAGAAAPRPADAAARALTRALADAPSLTALAGVAAAAPADGLNAIHVAAALGRAAQLAAVEGAAPPPALLAQLGAAWARALRGSPGAGTRELTSVLRACAKLRLGGDEALGAASLAALVARVAEANSQDVANAAWALGSLAAGGRGALPGASAQQVADALAALTARLAALPAAEVSLQAAANTLWAHAKLGLQPAPGDLDALLAAAAAQPLREAGAAQALSSTLWALSELHLLAAERAPPSPSPARPRRGAGGGGEQQAQAARPSPVEAVLGDAALARIGAAAPQAVANCLLALGRLSSGPGAPLRVPRAQAAAAALLAGPTAAAPLAGWNARDACNSLWAAAKLGVKDPRFLTAAGGAAGAGWLPGASAADVTQAAWACAKLKHRDAALVGALMARARALMHARPRAGAAGGAGARGGAASQAERTSLAATLCWAAAVLDLPALVGDVKALLTASGVRGQAEPLALADARALWRVHSWLLHQTHRLGGAGLAKLLSEQQLAACAAASRHTHRRTPPAGAGPARPTGSAAGSGGDAARAAGSAVRGGGAGTAAAPSPPGGTAADRVASARVDLGDRVEQVAVPLSHADARLVTLSLRFPLGLVLERSADGGAVVGELTPGGAADAAGVRLGDALRATTAMAMQMTYPAVNLLLGGVGRPRLVKMLLPAAAVPFPKLLDAVRSNTADAGGDGTVALVLERVDADAARGGGEREPAPSSDGAFDPEIFERTAAAPPCRIGLFSLQLQPRDLEVEFWRSSGAQRAMLRADAFAVFGTAWQSVAAWRHVWRSVRAAPPELAALFRLHEAVPSVAALTFTVVACAAATLGLMVARPAAYRLLRDRVALANRLLRLAPFLAQHLGGSTMPALAYTWAIGVRVAQHAGRPWRALAINLVQPTIFFLQQSCWLVPWRLTAPLQALVFVVSLAWSARLPCLLPLQALSAAAAAAGGGGARACAGGVVFQEQAEAACLAVRYVMAMAGTAAGDASTAAALQATPLCEGAAAVQLLQVFAATLMLLVLPAAVSYGLELSLKRSFLAAAGRRAEGPLPAWLAAGGGAGDGAAAAEPRPAAWAHRGPPAVLLVLVGLWLLWTACEFTVWVLQGVPCEAALLDVAPPGCAAA